MTGWEYYSTTDDSDLATLGLQGWELVAVIPGPPAGRAKFYFKRPAPDFRDQVTLDQKRRYFAAADLEVVVDDEARS